MIGTDYPDYLVIITNYTRFMGHRYTEASNRAVDSGKLTPDPGMASESTMDTSPHDYAQLREREMDQMD